MMRKKLFGSFPTVLSSSLAYSPSPQVESTPIFFCPLSPMRFFQFTVVDLDLDVYRRLSSSPMVRSLCALLPFFAWFASSLFFFF